MHEIQNEYFAFVFTKDKDMEDSEISTAEVLEDWQVADIVPLFKKGNRDNPGNYRPVVMRVIDEGRAVDVVNMDFSKAFDKVSH
eukprot:g35558.t1